MKPAAVSHVLMKIEHRFTSFIELLLKKKKERKKEPEHKTQVIK